MSSTVRSKPRPGRPRKSGAPARARRKALPLGVRRKIKAMLLAGKTRAEIKLKFKRHDPTDSQINAVKYGRSKTVKEPRTDSYDAPATEKVRTGKSITELLHDGVLDALEGLSLREGELPGERIAVIEKAARVDRHIKASELEAHLKHADARIIAAIVHRFMPEATTDQVVAIYREELAKIQAELNNE